MNYEILLKVSFISRVEALTTFVGFRVTDRSFNFVLIDLNLR